jgi:hypothetical protein
LVGIKKSFFARSLVSAVEESDGEEREVLQKRAILVQVVSALGPTTQIIKNLVRCGVVAILQSKAKFYCVSDLARPTLWMPLGSAWASGDEDDMDIIVFSAFDQH